MGGMCETSWAEGGSVGILQEGRECVCRGGGGGLYASSKGFMEEGIQGLLLGPNACM